MTTLIAKPVSLGMNHQHAARRWQASPSPKKPARPFPAISHHVPVTPRNRTYLRVVRQAEMAAWNAGATAGFPDTDFRRQQVAEKERRDLRAFGLVALLALATVILSLWKSHAMAAGWASLVQLMNHLIS